MYAKKFMKLPEFNLKKCKKLIFHKILTFLQYIDLCEYIFENCI